MPKKPSIQIPSEIEKLYPGITVSQYRLLCFVAYYGQYPSNYWKMTIYDENFNIPKNRTDKDRIVLKQNGWIDSNDSIPAQRYFDTILPMMRNFPEWVEIFEKFSHFRDDKDSYLWKTARCLAADDLYTAGRFPYPRNKNVWKYLSPLAYREEYAPVMSLMPGDERKSIIESTLKNAMEFDSLTEDLLDKTKSLVESWFSDSQRLLLDEVAAYRYFLTGEKPESRDEAPTMWSQATSAIIALQQDNLSESYELFYQALHLVEPFESRNVFSNQILTWFYGLCLAKCCRKLRSERARDALDAMLADSAMKFSYTHAATQTLLSHLEDISSTCTYYVASDIRTASNRHRSILDTYMYNIVLKHFKVMDKDIADMNLTVETLPNMKIIRSEFSPFAKMTSAERAELREAFSEKGIIGSMPRREGWEMALSELTGQVQQCQDEEEMEKRIIYFVDDKWITAILEQSRPAGSEEWGHDKLLSRNTLVKSGYDSMDVVDMKVARALGNRVIDNPDINVILPILAGTGRIFTGQHYHAPYTPLPVENEQPMLAFNGKDGKIEVTSNVRRMNDGSVSSCSITHKGDGFVCIKTNPMQRDIIKNLLDIGQFPASAAPKIRDTIESLKGIIEVHSDLAGLSVIATTKGSGRLALRISPDKIEDKYLMNIQAAPYEDGDLRCEPGQGNEDVYDDSDGEPRIIRRDLQLEYDNYMLFRDYAENEVCLEFESSAQCSIWASESLLKILSWAFDNRDKCFVEWPEGRALRFRGDVKSSDIDITVNSGINWFEVEGEIDLGDEKFKLEEILKAMKESEINGYIKLGDKDYIRMSDTIRKHLEALDEMMSEKQGRERVVPIYRVGHLAKVLGTEGGLNGTMDAGFTSLLDKMQEAYDSTPEVPATLNATLRDYQKEGYMWMKRLDAWGAGACLADDMGLGKTVQSLAFILSKASEGPSLVVAPKSVIPNWDIEAAKFAPSLNVRVLNNESNRKDCIAAAGPNDLILATYGVLGTEASVLASKSWNVVCLDEAHQIKNRNTRVSAAAMGLQASSRIILTGTPIQNHLGELWNLFQFINPGLLGQWSDFKSRYMQTGLDEEHKEFLKDLVQPFILRRTKEEVLNELPDKMVYEQMVELSFDEMALYEAMRQYAEANIKSAGGKGGKKGPDDKNKIQINFFAELTNLRLAACSMSLVHNDWKGGSSKSAALKCILDELSGNEGNRVLVFSQFTSYLAQIRAMLDKAGMRYLYLDGQTDLDERAELVTQFQNGDCPIFLASLKAGGLGLNLTAANYVILLDPWWNPAIENQAMDRAHRIGQKRNVTVIRLIAQHTIEEKILKMHETKQSLSDDMLDGTSDSWHLTMDDVLDMVSPFR